MAKHQKWDVCKYLLATFVPTVFLSSVVMTTRHISSVYDDKLCRNVVINIKKFKFLVHLVFAGVEIIKSHL